MRQPWSPEGVGLSQPPLDAAGREKARRLGIALGPRRPCLVVASPLRRATETAQPGGRRAGLPVTTDQRLIDRDYGPWTGTDKESVAARWHSVDDAPGV